MKVVKKIYYIFWIYYGFIYLWIFKKTPLISYYSFRKYYVLNQPSGFDSFNKLISFFSPYSRDINSGIIDLSGEKLDKVINELNTKGYFVFQERVDAGVINTINNSIDNSTFYHQGNHLTMADVKNINYPRFDYDNNQILSSTPALLELIFDDSFQTIASYFLKAKPYLDLLACWYSQPSNQGQSEAAQYYHYDLDRFKFIKFFIYLNDVSEDNGPHCYIESSNAYKFSTIEDRRYKDVELEQYYSQNQFKELTGSKGTIIAVDTIGYHKGKELLSGNRKIFQIEFTNSLFGQNYSMVSIDNTLFSEFLKSKKINIKFDEYIK